MSFSRLNNSCIFIVFQLSLDVSGAVGTLQFTKADEHAASMMLQCRFKNVMPEITSVHFSR